MGWLNWLRVPGGSATARRLAPDPQQAAREIVGALVPEVEAALLYGIPLATIRDLIIARDGPGWCARYGPEAAAVAKRLFEDCGVAAFLTPYGAEVMGLVLPRKKAWRR